MSIKRCFIVKRSIQSSCNGKRVGFAVDSTVAGKVAGDTGKNGIDSLPFAFKVAGIADKYNPRKFENKRYDACISAGHFSPVDTSNHDQRNFSMLLPPPNVTGSLHLGHVLTVAIQDAIARHRRMSGYRVNWLPGLDHAGIATQVQVEKHLASTGKHGFRTRHDIGRTRFVDECFSWKEDRANQINAQLKRVGASLNWEQPTFTLDSYIVDNVQRIFAELFERGLIYRDKMLVMHCPFLCSTISDIEVDWLETHKERDITVPSFPGGVARVGYMLHFAYLLCDADMHAIDTKEIVVATTRPETMLGDVAVAVHPDDARYAHLVGRLLEHPFFPGKTLPIIADRSVDPAFGTGALKITPAHDFNDFSIARQNGLTLGEQVIDGNGNIACKSIPDLHGKNRFHVRIVIEQMLNERGLVRLHESTIKTRVPLCSRSQDIVEPMLKEQWFLSTSELKQQAKDAVDSGQLEFTPQFFANVFRNWMQQRQDWCLSRQLWWGIQIPAYRATSKTGDSVWVCASNEEEARKKAVEKLFLHENGAAEQVMTVVRDDDVLDTWFSSGLLPFLTSKDTANPSYPLSLMETGHDILFFWVARMVMLGLACTGQLPFKRVLLHGLLCDERGKKMSKSKGNVIDPMKILCDTIPMQSAQQEHQDSSSPSDFAFDIGADAMRFALLRHDNLAVQLDFNVKQDIEAANKFCNKIWQSVRFIIAAWDADRLDATNLTANSPVRDEYNCYLSVDQILRHRSASPLDKWLLSRLAHISYVVDEVLNNTFQMQRATEALHQFWLENVCDVYIECIKPYVKRVDFSLPDSSFSSTDEMRLERTLVISSVLHHVASGFLHLAHPFMPFITDELYDHVDRYNRKSNNNFSSLCVAQFPAPESLAPLVDAENDKLFDILLRCVHEVRSLKSRYNAINLPMPVKILLRTKQNGQTEFSLTRKFLDSLKPELCILMRSPLVTVVECADEDDNVAAQSLLGPDYGVSAVTNNVHVAVKLEGFIDYELERERIVKKHAKLVTSLESLDRKLRRRTVPEQELAKLQSKRAQIVQQLDALDGMIKHLNSRMTTLQGKGTLETA